jgi:hypothetical protein
MMIVKIMMFVLCLNIACAAISSTFPLASTATAAIPSQEQVSALVNQTESWQPALNIPLVGDIVAGFNFFVQVVRGTLFGLPAMLQDIEAPSSLVAGAYALTGLVYALAIIQMISGRQVED